VRVDPDSMSPIPRTSRGWTQPARQHLAVKVEEGDQAVQLRHIHYFVLIDIDVTEAGKTWALRQKLPRGRQRREGNVHRRCPQRTAITMHPGPMRDVELARRALARHSPRLFQGAVRGEPVDAGVAVAIRDIDLARRRDGDIGRPMEGTGSLFDRIAVIARPAS